MTRDEALDLIRKLLKASDEAELVKLVSMHLPLVDGTFFQVAEASIKQLEQEEKPAAANALRSLTDRMLRMKTLI
jgi:hypothetical protein